jgi:hypothetical protein
MHACAELPGDEHGSTPRRGLPDALAAGAADADPDATADGTPGVLLTLEVSGALLEDPALTHPPSMRTASAIATPIAVGRPIR